MYTLVSSHLCCCLSAEEEKWKRGENETYETVEIENFVTIIDHDAVFF